MRELDWDQVRKEKDAYRDAAASLSFDEKLRVMERLRDRAVEVRDRTMGASTTQAQPASNSRFSAAHSQTIRSVAHLVLFGATATLAAAMVSLHSSSNAAVVAGKTDKPTG